MDTKVAPAVEEVSPTRSYRVMVLVSGERDFCGNMQRYATKEAAERAGADLYSRWFAVKEWRIDPSTDEPNV